MTDSSTKSDFNKMVEKLQRDVNEQALMTFSGKVIKEYNSPKNIGKMAEAITEVDLIAALDGLPEENLHCAHLAVITVRNALKMLT